MQLCTMSFFAAFRYIHVSYVSDEPSFLRPPLQVNLAKNHWDDECDTMVSLRSWLMADGIIVVGSQLCICLPEDGSMDRSHTLSCEFSSMPNKGHDHERAWALFFSLLRAGAGWQGKSSYRL